MAMGRAMGPEQPSCQTAVPSGLGEPSKAVPEEVLKLWASLPRRQRTITFVIKQLLLPLLRCPPSMPVSVISRAPWLIEFLHATAASIPVPPS